MKHTAKYTSLKETINAFISEACLTSAAYFRLYGIALRGFQELNMDVFGHPATRLLPVDPQNKTAQLPSGYMQWLKVGVINENGEVATLRRNTQLSKLADASDERLQMLQQTATGLLQSDNFHNYQIDGTSVNLLGIPGGTTYLGEFDVDDAQGLILLSPDYAYDYVLLECLMDESQEEDQLYPVQCREALIAFLRLKNILSVPSGRRQNLGLIDRYDNMWIREKRKARFRLRPFRLHEANDIIRLTNRTSIRS